MFIVEVNIDFTDYPTKLHNDIDFCRPLRLCVFWQSN